MYNIKIIINKMTNKNKIILGIVALVVLAVGGFFGYKYYEEGTVQYSANQLEKGFETGNKELVYKHFDKEAVFANVWDELVLKYMDEDNGSSAYMQLLGASMIANIKPTAKSGFFATFDKQIKPGERTFSRVKDSEGSYYIEIESGSKLYFVKKEGQRYWIVNKMVSK
jgi:hypothetical protein